MKTYIPLILILGAFTLQSPAEGPPPHRPFVDEWINQFKEQNPEEFERLKTLRDEDPAAFRKELRKRHKKLKRRPHGPPPYENSARLKELNQQKKELIQKLRDSSGPEHESVTAELRNTLEAIFDERESLRAQHLERVEKELEKHKSRAEKRRGKRDQIIEKELNKLIYKE